MRIRKYESVILFVQNETLRCHKRTWNCFTIKSLWPLCSNLLMLTQLLWEIN